MSARLKGVTDPAEVVRIVRANQSIATDPDIEYILENSGDATVRDLRSAIDLRALMEQPEADAPAKVDVKAIKSSAMYKDPGVDDSSNWLSRALDRLRNIDLSQKQGQQGPSIGGLGAFLYYLMWFLIACVIIALVTLAVMHIRWRQRLKRKVAAMLEDTEPERSLDEWLEQAALLESQGKFREAVRAMYLACLLRFDEARVARFDRGQTNWEHLTRIEASPNLPPGLDFRPPTQLFDRVWYGFQCKGQADSQQFREWYLMVTDALKGRVG